MATKTSTPAGVPTHVTISLDIRVHDTDRSWNGVNGDGHFETTVPIDALGAIDTGKLIAPLVAVARQKFAGEWAERQEKAVAAE